MPDTKRSGTDVLFKIGGQVVAGQTDCSFSIDADEINMSSKDTDYWKEFEAGRAEATISGSGITMLDTSAHTLAASQKAIYTAITTRGKVQVEIAFTDNLRLHGTAFFTNFGGDASDGQPANLSWSARVTSGLSLAEGND